jgi:hypothetical protein
MLETSKEAWDEVKGSGTQTENFKKILSVLNAHKGEALTGREICIKAGQEGLWKRLREMERQGWITMKEKRPCTITGKLAYTWVVKE